ncbi:MAG: sulfite exporter TauE/SafE family protein [Bacteroidales bacterium]|nr:sulfite exporter TauE/SafE family protein [Bacteroidales bacterium]
MTLTELFLLILVGLAAGFLAGTFGVGGGIIIVPALVFVFGMSQHDAQGTSLVVLLFPVGILAVWNYYKQGYVNFKFALVLILFFIIGGYFGSKLSIGLNHNTLKKLFGILMLVAGAQMIFGK